jgi:maltose alpha-D-glucosyltransferase/alpha-amylase
MYRKVDKGLHPDVELTRFLSDASLPTTRYGGVIEWRLGTNSFTLGMLEKLEENHGDGHHYMLERVANFIERILARDRAIVGAYPKLGSLTRPLAYEKLDDSLKEFIGGNAAELARLAGLRLAQIHKGLAAGQEKEVMPEEFSLHYQRSLFSSMSSLVREMGQGIEKMGAGLPAEILKEVKVLASKKDILLTTLKRITVKNLMFLRFAPMATLDYRMCCLPGRILFSMTLAETH